VTRSIEEDALWALQVLCVTTILMLQANSLFALEHHIFVMLMDIYSSKPCIATTSGLFTKASHRASSHELAIIRKKKEQQLTAAE